ncbi:MAG TPA: radical SAM protein [Kofleriaceae bacterium]|nr:radical SAM protein [Kofleriaceae bacterium]
MLTGSAARLWEVVVAIAALPASEQRDMIDSLSPELRPRMIAALAKLARAGAIEIDDPEDASLTDAKPRYRLRRLHLELTHRCNFSCRACYLGGRLAAAGDDPGGEVPIERWIALVHEAAALGCTTAVVTGGEPLLRKGITDLFAALSEHDIRFELNTNGSCVTPAVVQALRGSTVWSVEVSLYGYDAASHAGYSDVRGGYAATLRGVRLLSAAGVPVQVKYFATAPTAHGLDAVRAELEPLGVPVICKGHAIHGDIFEGRLPDAAILPELEKSMLVQDDELPCGPSFTTLAIAPDGEVRACPKLGIHFGNAFAEGLTAIWERSTELEAFRSFWVDYCHAKGYVRGARTTSLCPAAAALSHREGLVQLRTAWNARREGERP